MVIFVTFYNFSHNRSILGKKTKLFSWGFKNFKFITPYKYLSMRNIVLCFIAFWYILLILQALSNFVLNIFLLLLTYISFFSRSLSCDQIGSCSKWNHRWTLRSLANLARCRRDPANRGRRLSKVSR